MRFNCKIAQPSLLPAGTHSYGLMPLKSLPSAQKTAPDSIP